MSKHHKLIKGKYRSSVRAIKTIDSRLEVLRRAYKYAEKQHEKDRILKEANRIKEEKSQLMEYQIKLDSALKDWFNMTQSDLDELLGDK
jgi:hypothetical protein